MLLGGTAPKSILPCPITEITYPVAPASTVVYLSPSFKFLNMKNERENNSPAATESKQEADGKNQQAQGLESLTQEQLTDLKDKAGKADEYYARLLREAADSENYKKRAARERQEAIKFANEGLLHKLIPIIDNFEMAMTAANTPSTDPSVESLKKGVQMVHSLLKSTLAEAGLEEIDATGQPFDPNFHEAVSQQATAEVPEGHVVQQMRKGYRFKERLLRPATVVVARKP